MISRELAAQAALELIDAEGIDGLSLEKVALKLGARAPSLYYHLRNKAELFAEVTQLMLRQGEAEISDHHSDWREAVIDIALATRRSILRHPRAAILLLRFFPRHLMLPSYERWMEIYAVEPSLKMVITEGVEKLTFGSALFSANCREQGVATMPNFDRNEFPQLANAVAANGRDEEAEFVEILRRFLSTF